MFNEVKNFFDCTVVVVSGGKPRTDLTIETLNCINSQKLRPREKIFINHGHTESTMKQISDSQELSKDWKIINFPINTYDPTDLDSLFRFTGPTALDAATSEYIFYIADDDKIDVNFFEKMFTLIEGNPGVIVASGLAVGISDTGTVIYPPKGSWDSRQKYEQGITIFRNIYRPDELFHPNPGHSYVIKRNSLNEVRSSIFKWGFPDVTPLFQIVPKGIFAFDKEALMLRKNHIYQIHNEWDEKNTQINLYLPHLKKMSKSNIGVLKGIEGITKSDLRLAKKHFKRQVTRSCWFSLKNVVPDFDSNLKSIKTPFLTKLKYLLYMLKTPIYSFRLFVKPGRLKIYLTRKLVKCLL
jgi:hypothetical protein